MKPTNTSSLSYADSGVNIAAGNSLVERIKPIAQRTKRPGVLAGLGGFGALFELPLERYRQPILVSSTDGVGTKLKIATALNQHDTIGIDLVAMCVNDIVVQGAEPLFFLDYFATSRLQLEQASAIIAGIGKGCEQAGAALIGGETAEMPGVYHDDEYDLAGFAVGIVEKSKIIDGSKVKAGDTLIGIASSGLHSNGFSLVRKIIELNNIDLNTSFDSSTLGKNLLTPTRIYVKSLLALIQKVEVNAMAHITGGGLVENIPRVLPPYTQAIIDHQTWHRPKIFNWLEEQANISSHEMYRTFNCGIGMVVCVPKSAVDASLALLETTGEQAWIIGEIIKSDEASPSVKII